MPRLPNCFRRSMVLACLWPLALAAALRADEPVKKTSDDAATEKSGDLPRGHEEFFETKVRPILVKRCYECHGPAKQESGLRLDSRTGVLAGGDDGPVAAAGKPDDSLLVAAIRYGGDIEMPPKGKLPADEIAALTRWVELGLPWPEDTGGGGAVAPMTDEQRFRHARATLWSLKPIERRALPPVKEANWPRMPIDYYVLAKLEAAGLSPSPPADRRTLLRRAKFDLVGLPPTPEEAEAFLADDSPDAYERLIDRLLASPAYGERWGRHWLDVARYADTRGYAFGKERKFPFAYTYRDWVIKALNADAPYNDFVVQQLAADRLPDNPPAQLAALGFLTVGRKYSNEQDDIDDQIDVVTRGLLGLTVACARCHDHKYDAIPTGDYYSLYGVFASSTRPKEYPLISSPEENAAAAAYKTELDRRKMALEDYTTRKHAELLDGARRSVTEYLVRVVTQKPEELLAKLPFISLNADDLRPRLITAWRQYLREHAQNHPVFMPLAATREIPEAEFAARCKGLIESWKDLPEEKFNPLVAQALIDKPPQSKEELARRLGDLLSGTYAAWKDAGGNDAAKKKLSRPQLQLLEILLADGGPTSIPRGELVDYLNRGDRNQFRKLEKDVESHVARSPAAPARAMSLVDKPQPVEPVVFIRGNRHRRGERVPRQFLRLLAGDERKPFTDGSGRLELARAIADPANPLTPRVIVNRVWMHHFGAPLVATPSDFGARSEPPVQLDVLDYLAARLMESGWSLKQLHREIMLSATYRQASSRVGRGSNLSKRSATPSSEVDPENQLLGRMNRRRLDFEPLRDALLAAGGNLDRSMYGRPDELFTNLSLRRRSVYGFIDRQDLPGLLRSFDFASPDQSSARRPQTTVPQQALFMMNSPFAIEQARALVARPEVASATEPKDRIAALYRLLFARSPSEEELSAGVDFIAAAQENKTDADKLTPWEQYAQLLMMTNEFTFVD